MKRMLFVVLCIAGFAMAEEPTIPMLVTAKEQAKLLNARRPAAERLAEAKAAMAKMQADRLAKMTEAQRIAEEARLAAQAKERERIAALPMDERFIEMLKARKTQAEAEATRLTAEIAVKQTALESKPVIVPVVPKPVVPAPVPEVVNK
jgi:uncharacterized protein with WD repeat